MTAAPQGSENGNGTEDAPKTPQKNGSKASGADPESADDSDDDGEEEEPQLKYTKLTGSLSSVYRGGDDTSTFFVGGDKLVIGTHNGNIHTLSLTSLQSLRTYHAHSASVTALSISPIYIASASVDGHVCVSSLVDPMDVTLRNFARPVQAVALSPEYKYDRTYLSGGLAGNLILTVGGKAGVSSEANTNSAAAAAQGWLGSIGLGSNTGKDTILHSGEGSIASVKFSRTGKFVAWINEHGIKIMRSHMKLDSADLGFAWKRIAHVDRPGRDIWQEMAAVWKGRMEWIGDKGLEQDDGPAKSTNGPDQTPSKGTAHKRRPEKLVVGWGDTAWVLHVHVGGHGVGKHAGERSAGRADIVHKLTFDDCILSGLSLYTPSLLAVLAYRTRDDDDQPIASTPRRHRQSALSPELRLVDVASGEEVDVDTLTVSRYESLSVTDYHLGTIYIPPPLISEPAQRGAFETLNAGFWDISAGATRMFSSALQSPGLKIFIQTPYDCVLAVKRNPTDHLTWLMEHHKYKQAWDLVDVHPEVEKRKIGDLWLQQLVAAKDWKGAGEVAGKVLGTSSRWEHWVLAFAQANRFDEIAPYIPSTDMQPPLPSFVYEVVLGHYISSDPSRFAELLEKWDPELFDISSVATAIETRLDSGDITEDGETATDWRTLMAGLAKLKLAGGQSRQALRYYIRLQDAEAAMSLIKDYHLTDAIAEDIPGLLMLRVSRDSLSSGSMPDLREASAEAISLLVEEAYNGIVAPSSVVTQLTTKGAQYAPFTYLYFAQLWRGPEVDEDRVVSKNFANLALSLFATYDRDLLSLYLRTSTAYTLDKALGICDEQNLTPELVYLLSKTGQTKKALFLIIEKLGDVSQAISFAKEHSDLWDDLLDYSMDKPRFIRALLHEVGTSIDAVKLVQRIPEGLEIEGLKEGVQKMVREYDIQFSISEGVARVLRGEVAAGMEVKHRRAEHLEVKINPALNSVDEDVKNKVGPVVTEGALAVSDNAEFPPGHCVGCGELFEEDESDFLIGFACGHVFHLECLLDKIRATRQAHDLIDSLRDQTQPDGAPDADDTGSAPGSFGALTRAIGGGCPVCAKKAEAVDM
ncbi:hypothetical protein ANO11243_073500 [Dothideomycetidae sp. 11243]|nr:hypothetical protein ANO11243_073500 [fungal sp. No.11243]